MESAVSRVFLSIFKQNTGKVAMGFTELICYLLHSSESLLTFVFWIELNFSVNFHWFYYFRFNYFWFYYFWYHYFLVFLFLGFSVFGWFLLFWCFSPFFWLNLWYPLDCVLTPHGNIYLCLPIISRYRFSSSAYHGLPYYSWMNVFMLTKVVRVRIVFSGVCLKTLFFFFSLVSASELVCVVFVVCLCIFVFFLCVFVNFTVSCV